MQDMYQETPTISLESYSLERHHQLEWPLNTENPELGSIPVHVFVGRKHRPCLALVAGVHGNEYDGILALQELTQSIDAKHLDGSIVVIPVVNTFAFSAGQRYTPEDNGDLNRVFPGNIGGGLTERLAHVLSQQILVETDLIFTLHGARQEGVLAPWIEFLDENTPVGKASFEAAMASGFPDLIALSDEQGVLLTAMGKLGVPLIEGEVGGRGKVTRDGVEYYQNRITDVATHMGIIKADPGSGKSDFVEIRKNTQGTPRIWNLHDVLVHSEGIFVNTVEIKQSVQKGAVLGKIIDKYGRVVEEVESPFTGEIGHIRKHAGVRHGDSVYIVWTPAEPNVLG